MRSKSKRYKKRKEKLIENIKTLNIIVFISTLAIFSISTMVIPKENISQMEKRELTEFPTLTADAFFSGDYFKQIESFYNDTFAFRDKFINLASNIDDIKGVRQGEDEIKIYTVKNN